MSTTTRGVILGRFMPPHNGHRYLIDFGRHIADELTVFLCSLPPDPIPGALRLQWMQEIFPTVRLVHITEENPNANKNQPGATAIWARALAEHMPHGVDYVFASEHYGFDLARELGARFVPVDPSRSLFPVSATAVRAAPMTYWDYLPEPVRPFFVRRVCIAGADVRRRVALGRALSQHFKTIYSGDYARFWQDHMDRPPQEADLPLLMRAQAASEGALARQADRLLFVTTDPTQLALQWRVQHGEAADRLAAERQGGYDLYLIMEGSAGSDPDGLASRYRSMIPTDANVVTIPVPGDPNDPDDHIGLALEPACAAVEELLRAQ